MDELKNEQARASREATDWLILLQEEPDDAELQRCFEAWLQMKPVHRSAWAATRRTADVLNAASSMAVAGSAPHRGRQRPTLPPVAPHKAIMRRRSWRRNIVQTMATGLAACLLLVVFAPKIIMHMQADYMTASGEIRSVDLADGSRIVLAPDSAIALDFDAAARQVRLLAGEALFEVVPAADRPFEVAVRTTSTRVLGTVFSVRHTTEGINVAVVEGRVQVAHTDLPPAMSEMLNPGETVQMDWNGSVIRDHRLPDDIAAWRTGDLIASDEPVADVIDRLRPYYSGVILLADDELAAQTITGVYSLDDPQAALKAIAEAHHARLRQVSPWLVIVSK